jgi:serine protease Do
MPVPVPGRVAEALRRSTVEIHNGHRVRQGNGSGAVIGPDQVVTNAHVVQGGTLSITAWEGKVVSGSVVRIDRRRDLALVSAPGLNAPVASLGDSDALRAGTPLFAIGNPLGFVGAVSSGVVHAVGSLGPGFLGGLSWVQADLRLAPGNSGGPLADFQGQVVGINTMVVSGGLGLAVPSRAVQVFLCRRNSPQELGVVLRPVSIRAREIGMLLLELVPGGAAEAASLLPGDILIAANDRRFRFVDDLQTAIEDAPAGLLPLDFCRGGHSAIRRVVARLQPEQARNAA